MSENPKMPCRDLNELHPYVKQLCEKFLEECKKEGINVIVTQTYRTIEYQQQLYNQGRTIPGSIVTNCRPGYSPHNYRLAFDIAIIIDGKVNWNTPLYDKAGAIGEKIGLTWGGRFKSLVDKPHFEWTGGLTISQLLAGKRPVAPAASTTPSTVKPAAPVLKRVLKKGMQGDDVEELQKALQLKGYNHLVRTKVFDINTLNCVLDFQKKSGLTADGIVGQQTWGKLFQ